MRDHKATIARVVLFYNGSKPSPYLRIHVRGIQGRIKGMYLPIIVQPLQFREIILDLFETNRPKGFGSGILHHAHRATGINDKDPGHMPKTILEFSVVRSAISSRESP